MTVYVDALFEATPQGDTPLARQARRNGRRWCHMFADTLPELHAMADQLGLKRAWFQPGRSPELNHYDLVPSKRALAVRLGAQEISTLEYMRARRTEVR